MKTSKLNLKAGITLPQTVILPMRLVRETGAERRFVVKSRTQEVPGAIADWLRLDTRYAGWFEPTAYAQAVADRDPVAIMAAVADPLDTLIVEDDVDAWSADMNVPTLRDYAKQHGVDLLSDDRKDDVIAKLRAAGLPETVETE